MSGTPEELSLLKVSNTSNVKDVASRISSELDRGGDLDIRAIGAGAVNQAAKAIAIARGMMAVKGRDLTTRIGFATIKSTDGDISALVFRLTAH